MNITHWYVEKFFCTKIICLKVHLSVFNPLLDKYYCDMLPTLQDRINWAVLHLSFDEKRYNIIFCVAIYCMLALNLPFVVSRHYLNFLLDHEININLHLHYVQYYTNKIWLAIPELGQTYFFFMTVLNILFATIKMLMPIVTCQIYIYHISQIM